MQVISRRSFMRLGAMAVAIAGVSHYCASIVRKLA